jgi:rhodanese-related sulfurtransferase
LLDVRTEAEFKEKRIPGALLLPVEEVKKRAATVVAQKEALILVYCRSGGRSAKAARELAAMGYTNLYDLGGLNSWPYATEKD